MGHIDRVVLAVVNLALLLLIVRSPRRLIDAAIDVIENFRGGPPSAMHPSPSNDGALLRRKNRKSER